MYQLSVVVLAFLSDQVAFTIKGVGQDIRYLNRANNSGLTGMTLIIGRSSHYFTPSGSDYQRSLMVAILGVSSVSCTSAMCQTRVRNGEIRREDTAWLCFVEPMLTKKPPLSSWRESAPSTTNNLEKDTQTSSHPVLPLAKRARPGRHMAVQEIRHRKPALTHNTQNQQTFVQPGFSPKPEAPAADAARPSCLLRDLNRSF